MSLRSVVLSVLTGVFALAGGAPDGEVTAAGPKITSLVRASWMSSASAMTERNALDSRLSAAREGVVRLLTYNVAGLPALLSGSRPIENIPQISRLIDAYDVALVQEDFAYHRELIQHLHHAFRSPPSRARHGFLGDGLNSFSVFPSRAFERVGWRACNGVLGDYSDCLADKGFTVSETTLARGTTVHIYNVHADAGRAADDWRARAMEFAQLANFIREHSRGQAIVVAGDTNLNDGFGDRVILQTFLNATGLVNTCGVLECGHETFDKVFVRSSDAIELTPLLWYWDSRFVDSHRHPLSDHPALRVDVGWRNLR